MLVLSRHEGEEIDVTFPGPPEIRMKIKVVLIGRGKVRIGLDADASVIIDRGEVTKRKEGKPC